MKPQIPEITPQYIIDKTGKKTGVILDIQTFEKLLSELEDIYFGTMAEAALEKAQEYIDHEEIKKSLS